MPNKCDKNEFIDINVSVCLFILKSCILHCVPSITIILNERGNEKMCDIHVLYVSRHEKSCLLSLQPGSTQGSL